MLILAVLLICMLMCGCWTMKIPKRVSFAAEYIVYGTMSCGYTVKMVKHLENIGKSFKFVDITQNSNVYESVLKHFNVKHIGVPFTVHKPSDTYFVGFKAIK